MSVIKKPYEISIWKDVLIYVGKDSNNNNIESQNIEDLVTVDYQYYTEEKLAIIGSDVMDSFSRARNPVFKTNINGTETLTFDMYYQYEEEGEIVRNPLVDLVIDERKVKLFYEDKWHDFIVKKDDEKGREYKYSYTCTGLAANELGKTGYNIELDTELENNMGTVQELGEEVLRGSDWQLSQTGQERIDQTNDEALYRAFTNTAFYAKIRGLTESAFNLNKTIYYYYYNDNNEDQYIQCTILDDFDVDKIYAIYLPVNSIIYIYYTSFATQESNYFQFIYVTDNGTPDLLEDGITINCNNTRTFDLFLNNVTWENEVPNFINNSYNVADYRGRRYVKKQLSTYDPVLERAVLKYTRDNTEYYGYTTTEYIDSTTVQNYIYNSTNFSGTSYWGIYDSDATNVTKSIDDIVYPSVQTDNINLERAGYLVVNFGNSTTARLVNEGIIQNYSRINKFDKSEKYRFRIYFGTVNDEGFNVASTLPFRFQVRKYTKIDEDSQNDIIYFDSNGIDPIIENDYIIVDMECLQSATWRELKENVGIFFIPNAADSNDYYIKDVQFYKYVVGKNNVIIAPDDPVQNLPDVRVETKYHFYNPLNNRGKLSEEDYVFSEPDPTLYTPLYGSGENEFEKVRSITAKESNRFNLLQELSETFECWVRFEIEHETNGQIKIENFDYYNLVNLAEGASTSGYYIYDWISKNYITPTEQSALKNQKYYELVSRKRQIKKVIFYKEILIDNYAGFKYGINLKDNNRTLDSEQIVTKIIVKDNTCDQADNGFCSISRAKDNPIKENFVYNFDYYTSQGLINPSTMNNDLYLEINGSIGLYPRLSRLNKERNDLIDSAAPLANSINDLTSKYQVASLTYNEAEKELQRMKDPKSGTIVQYTHYIFEDFYNQINRRVYLDAGEIEQGRISNGANNSSNYRVRTKDYIKVQSGHKYNFNTNAPYIYVVNFTDKNSNSYISGSGWKAVRANGYSYTIPASVEYIRLVFAKNSSSVIEIVPSDVEFITIVDEDTAVPSYANEIYYINSGNANLSIGVNSGNLLFAVPTQDTVPDNTKTYYYISGSKFIRFQNTKFRDGAIYYEEVPAQYTTGTYFQTPDGSDITLTFSNVISTDEVYIYGAARRRIEDLGAEDYINDNFTISTLQKIVTQEANKEQARQEMERYGADLEATQAQYDSIQDQLKTIANATNEVEREFIVKYARYIQEGSWTDDNYMDDDLYYLDALSVLYQSAYPKVSYNFSVIDLSALEEYEPYKFEIAHKTYVEDTEFFGYKIVDNLRTPVREQVVVTEASKFLDENDKNQLKIQNYKSHFEDLFQRITAATQTLEYHSGEYGRAAGAITATGEVSESVMQRSLANSAYVISNSRDQSVTWDETGLQAINLKDPAQITRLASAGLLVSADGGNTWGVAISGYGINTNYLTAGVIDADNINIMSGAYPTFRWDSTGLNAYGFTTDVQGNILSYDPTRFVNYSRFGLYGVNGLLNPDIDSLEDIENNAAFALTWNGLFMRAQHRDGFVRVSPTEDFAVYQTITENNQNIDVLRGKFGLLGEDEDTGDEIFGLALYKSELDENNAPIPTVLTQSDGTLWLLDSMRVGKKNETNTIYIGVGETDEVGSNKYRVISANDNFIVYSDGSLKASNVELTGGTIGNMSIASLDNTIGVRITPTSETFKVNDDVPTPSSTQFEYKTSIQNITSKKWKHSTSTNIDFTIPDGTGDTYTYTYNSADFNNGIMYLGLAITSGSGANAVTYTDRITISEVSNGEQGQPGENAGQFSIHTNVEEILKFNSGEFFGNKIKYSFSSDVIQINGYNLSIQQFFPITSYSAIIKIYGQNLKDVIKEEYYDLYVYNENGDLNSYYFDLKKLYNDLYSGDLDNRINSTYSSMISTLKNFFESQNSEDIEIFAQITLSNNSVVNVEKFLQVKNGLSEEMVRFDVNASNITAAIQDAGLIFNSNGLTVTNSGFKIRTGNDNDGYTNVFYIDDNTKLLYMNGNGVFHGSIYAENGEFTGTVNASSGNIGGFSINNHSIVSENLELYSTYSENGITNESIIKVKNIEIGTGAEVKGRIKIGNLELLNPQENDNNVLTLISNDVNYFTITDNGNIIGNNWSIRDTANGVVADFGKIVARDGDFSGTIHATDGDFTGAINSSIINASIINTANFVTEKTRTMGGTFIFKPTFQIEKIEQTEANNVLKITLNSESNTSIEDYIPDLSVINTDVIVGISGNDTRYGKITSKDGAIIYVYLYDVDYSTVLTQKENYNIATLFGYGNYTDLLIGINSDDNSAVLPSRSLVMEEFTNLINNNNIGDINYQVRLLLGDLSNAPEGSGYGLYADNVFLRGSLTTAGSTLNNSYAGINTQRAVQFNYNDWSAGIVTGQQPVIYANDKIIFWGGAEGSADAQIQTSPFIVTDKGNVFARSGEFKGSVISDSLITNTIIKAPIIQGNNTTPNEPSLKIYNTDNNKVGIGFYKQVGSVDEESGESDDVLTLVLSNNGFTHYYNGNGRQFVSFGESSNQISINIDRLNIGTTSLRQNYLEDGQDYIQLNNGIKIASAAASIQVSTNEIINDATTITNKNSMVIRNGSGTQVLKYTINNGYYCLYVEE